MIARAKSLLPAGHGQLTARVDSGFYSVELMTGLRRQQVRFSMSAPRTSSMWRAMAEIPEQHWADAEEMRDAEVAETTLTPHGWGHEPLRLIVRRVSVSAEEIHRGSPRARRRVLQIASRAQHRLYRVHKRMRERKKPGNVITVACARELACFLWAAATAP